MTRQSLLQSSIQDYQIKDNNATLYKTKRMATEQGFMVIILQEATPLSCAIHYREHYNLESEFGKTQEVRALLNTREPIGTLDCVYYDNLYFFIERQDDYNEVMGQYHYELLASYGYLDKRFIIANESDLISENLATNSYPYLYQYLKDYPIYPKSFVIVFSQVPTKADYKYILLETSNTRPQSLINNIEANNVTLNNLEDIKLYCVNFSQQEALNLAYKITDSIAKQSNIGLISLPKIEQVERYIKELGIKALNHCVSFSINYKITTQLKQNVVVLKEALFTMLSLGLKG